MELCWSKPYQIYNVHVFDYFFPEMYCLITSEAAIPPWVGYNEEETMKNQILALSTVSRRIQYFIV